MDNLMQFLKEADMLAVRLGQFSWLDDPGVDEEAARVSDLRALRAELTVFFSQVFQSNGNETDLDALVAHMTRMAIHTPCPRDTESSQSPAARVSTIDVVLSICSANAKRA